MADLLSTATLARWTQNDAAEVAADEFATDLITKVSDLVCFLSAHDGTHFDELGTLIPEWSLAAGTGTEIPPIDVQMVVLQVCKRSYENPGQVIQEGGIGPIGGDRVADVQALFLELTDSERAVVTKYNPDGDPTPDVDGPGFIFTIATTRGDETTLPQTSPLYVGDDQQINLATSPDPREWMIPLFNPGDPGDDSLYA